MTLLIKSNFKSIQLKVLTIALGLPLLACVPPPDTTKESVTASSTTENKIQQAQNEYLISSLDDLQGLFKSLNYDSENWKKGNREVPRLIFSGVSENWSKSSSNIPVQLKKDVFFRLMAPLVLMSNERILAERGQILNKDPNSATVKRIAKKYKVIETEEQSLTPELITELLLRVDIMPPSLALAQAAEESGWGTSRFAFEGNAFFGQWDFSGKGMIPKQQRKELGNYGLARFSSPLASVEGYMYNINISAAYNNLRMLRAELRADRKPITGMKLAETLDKYSERGQAYIESIQGMISYNKLQDVDEAYLSDAPEIHLRRKYL